MGLLTPILWTAASVAAAVFIIFFTTGTGIWGALMILFAVACAVLQWMVYFKKKR